MRLFVKLVETTQQEKKKETHTQKKQYLPVFSDK